MLALAEGVHLEAGVFEHGVKEICRMSLVAEQDEAKEIFSLFLNTSRSMPLGETTTRSAMPCFCSSRKSSMSWLCSMKISIFVNAHMPSRMLMEASRLATST